MPCNKTEACSGALLGPAVREHVANVVMVYDEVGIGARLVHMPSGKGVRGGSAQRESMETRRRTAVAQVRRTGRMVASSGDTRHEAVAPPRGAAAAEFDEPNGK